MSYIDHFRHSFGGETAQEHPWITFYRPEALYDLAYIQQRDKYAAADLLRPIASQTGLALTTLCLHKDMNLS